MTGGPQRATVEVLVVSYNTRELLANCLASVEAHRPANGVEVRVSVCDNGSSDGSADMVSSRFPEARLLRQEGNLGFARANNVLTASSTADYLLLLNPDTVLVEDAVTPLLRVLLSDPRIVAVGPRLVFPDGTVQPSSQRFPGLDVEVASLIRGTRLGRVARRWFDAEAVLERSRQLGPIQGTKPRDTDFLWATCWLIRRADVASGELFDPHFSTYDEDLDFCRRHRDRGRRIVYVPEVTVVHIGGQSSRPELKRRLERRGRARYYRQHGGLARSMAFVALTVGMETARTAKRWIVKQAGARSLTSRRRAPRPAASRGDGQRSAATSRRTETADPAP
jgi:N-acetylglucosaminyl-diphospho-decaprenol L-rhamnosyltransferase